MTREEAIKIIDCYDIGFYDLSGEKIPADKLADAFDMAIDALSANCTTEKPNGEVEQGNDVVVEPTDLISRAELLDRIKAINSIPWGGDHGNAVKLVWSTEEVKRLIEKAPSADRPSGEWIKHNDRSTIIIYYTCSECGEVESGTPPYCRKCGAKMGSDTR